MSVGEGLADLLADEILRRFDAACQVDVDRRVAEQTRREHRNGYVGQSLKPQRADIEFHSHLSDVEFVELQVALKIDRENIEVGEVHAFGLDAAVEERLGHVVIPAREREIEVCHGMDSLGR